MCKYILYDLYVYFGHPLKKKKNYITKIFFQLLLNYVIFGLKSRSGVTFVRCRAGRGFSVPASRPVFGILYITVAFKGEIDIFFFFI